MNPPRARIKPGRASLIGGMAVTIAVFLLWVAVIGELGFDTPMLRGLGLAVAVGIGAWIRAADL